MRNTKKVIAATAAVATLVGLAACGSSSDNSAVGLRRFSCGTVAKPAVRVVTD